MGLDSPRILYIRIRDCKVTIAGADSARSTPYQTLDRQVSPGQDAKVNASSSPLIMIAHDEFQRILHMPSTLVA
jgi:hypothetical protein